jgi:hypothetical protein
MTLRHSRRYSKSINSLTRFLEAADDVSQALYVLCRRGGDLCLFPRIAASKIHQSVNSNNSTSRAGECSTARPTFMGSRESTHVGEGDAEGGEEGGVAVGDGSGVPLHDLHRRRHLTRGGGHRWGRRDHGKLRARSRNPPERDLPEEPPPADRWSLRRQVPSGLPGDFFSVSRNVRGDKERQRAWMTCLGLVPRHVLRWPAGT